MRVGTDHAESVIIYTHIHTHTHAQFIHTVILCTRVTDIGSPVLLYYGEDWLSVFDPDEEFEELGLLTFNDEPYISRRSTDGRTITPPSKRFTDCLQEKP